jgi:PPE-repeat protein
MSGFGAMPPEVTSALMYAGPGSSSLMAASSAWSAVAAELTSTAQGYDTIVTQLAGEEWLGPTSATMASAAQPYVNWLATTAGQAEQMAGQAQSAAAAFETAFASVVPPPLIAANRAELAQAQATNLFGLNNSVIAQLEGQYAEFWAQNSSTMSNYAASSAAATKTETFAAAPSITNATGTGTQAAAVAAAAATPAQSIQSYLQGALTNLQTTLTKLTNQFVGPAASSKSGLTEIYFLLTGQTILPTNLGALTNGYAPYASFFYNTEGLPYFSVGMGNFGTQIAKSSGALGGAAPAAAAKAVPSLGGGVGGAGGQVAAGLGSGAHVGHLAVPSSWPGTTTTPTVRPAVQAISEPITAGEGSGGAGNLVGGMPVGAGMPGRGAGTGPRYGFKPTIMARPLPAG